MNPAVKTKEPQKPKLKSKTSQKNGIHIGFFLLGIGTGTIIIGAVLFLTLITFENKYKNKVYPGVASAETSFTGLSAEEITALWLAKNTQFQDVTFTFSYETHVATLSGKALELGFDASLSATQALSVGRSNSFLSNLYMKYKAWHEGLQLTPLFSWKKELLDETINHLAQEVSIAPQNALFEFKEGRVSAFKPAKTGREVNVETLNTEFLTALTHLSQEGVTQKNLVFVLPVVPKEPDIATEEINNLGIKELIGRGESYFKGSIPGRIHNVALAAARVNGVLIPSGETFSFNQTVGDISAATGYKQAYVIKDGRTVLDDGGGVCQVSTTVFRAALNAGLPIVERHAHSYRVGYYEQGSWKPGFDATVYAPSYDLKIKNDTNYHILIQAQTDTANTKLVFEFYGTKDGRITEISTPKLWDFRPAPEDLIQDDPTLPVGTMKQVDWANSGAKASFDYVVKKGDQELFKKTFYSNYIPWQAVYLKGTKT